MLIHAYRLEWLGDGDAMRPDGQDDLQAALDVVRRMVNAGTFDGELAVDRTQSIEIRLVGPGTSDAGTGGSGGDYCARLVLVTHPQQYRKPQALPDLELAEGTYRDRDDKTPPAEAWVFAARRLAKVIADKAYSRSERTAAVNRAAASACEACHAALPDGWGELGGDDETPFLCRLLSIRPSIAMMKREVPNMTSADTIQAAAWCVIAAAFVATLVLVALEWRARLADRAGADEQFRKVWLALEPLPALAAKVESLTKRALELESRVAKASGLAETLPGPVESEGPRVVEVTAHKLGNGAFALIPKPPRVPALGEGLPKVHSDVPPAEAKAGNTIVGYAPPVPGRWMPNTPRPGIDSAAGEGGGQ